MMAARQLSLRGADSLQQQKYNDAEALFAEALKNCPTDERAHWGMAEVLFHQGNHAAATRHMHDAVQLSQSNPDLLVRLGEMRLAEGQSQQALQQANMALESNRQHAGAWELCGCVHQQGGDWEKAMEAYHRSLMTDPNNPAVQMALARAYYEIGKPQRALATLERMSDLQAKEYQSAETWMLKGAALAKLGQMDESRLCLREAQQRADDGQAQVLLNLARLQAEQGDMASARTNLGRVLSKQPNLSEALLVQSELEQKFLAEARTGGKTDANSRFPTQPVSGPAHLPTPPPPQSSTSQNNPFRPNHR
jgi:Tfp pilus assembly protein PilF